MKNKSTMLLVGIGIAYILYRLYAKKSIIPGGILQTNEEPLALYPSAGGGANYVEPIRVPSQFLVDSVPTAEVPDTPSTYQTLYVSNQSTGNRDRILGMSSKVPSTC
jgi:hypothetical protein